MTYLTVEQVAVHLHKSPKTVRAMAARRAIPCRRPPGTRPRLFVAAEVDAWLDGAELLVEELGRGGVVVRPAERAAA